MKKLKSLIIIVVLLLTGCRTHDEYYDLAACGSYGVPGMFCFDLKNGTFPCQKLDEDAQGRVLFSYTTYSAITQKEETAIVICQMSNPRKVCFYEDQCYYLGKPDDQKTSELKVQNDWGKPLDYSKMAMRPYTITIDLQLQTNSGLDYMDLNVACCQEFFIEEDQLLETIFLDNNHCGQRIYWIEWKNNSCIEKYIIMVNDKYEVIKMKANGSAEDMANLVSFKEQNAWYAK